MVVKTVAAERLPGAARPLVTEPPVGVDKLLAVALQVGPETEATRRHRGEIGHRAVVHLLGALALKLLHMVTVAARPRRGTQVVVRLPGTLAQEPPVTVALHLAEALPGTLAQELQPEHGRETLDAVRIIMTPDHNLGTMTIVALTRAPPVCQCLHPLPADTQLRLVRSVHLLSLIHI